ncbi:MAG TPA: ornithine carbamoyltransferase [Deltaproteobacteria bacterium]|nr:ornithine carbamoyltransferase [Deltaproteobacteria bacterium]
MKKLRHFLTLLDYSARELSELLALAAELKARSKKGKEDRCLQGKILAMVFEKSSTRTRISFEAAMLQLGGHSVTITSADSQLGRGESYEDTARVLSRYCQGIVLRTFSQVNLEKMAEAASVPVINGLTDLFHPVQVMADLQTVLEVKKTLDGLKVTYVGDGNNLANSWINAAIVLDFDLNVSCPPGYQASGEILHKIGQYPKIRFVDDPTEAVKSSDVIYTDTWFSMGQKEDEAKRKLFAPYQVNRELVSHAARDVMVLHCLPAHREEEITGEVLDGPHSYVWEEAENRLHMQKAILKTLLS